jgi:heme oxygenase
LETQAQVTDFEHREGGAAVAMLRRQTRHAHCRLEGQLGVMSPALSWGEYGSLLVGFAAVHQALDLEIGAQLEQAGSREIVDLDFPARRRTPLLVRDLARLGLPLPAPVTFPLSSLAGALGALYVSEGSMLGGRVIVPHVRRVLGPDAPVAFFESAGTDVATRWSSCRRVIDRLLVTRSGRIDAAEVAVAVFDRFSEVLRR